MHRNTLQWFTVQNLPLRSTITFAFNNTAAPRRRLSSDQDGFGAGRIVIVIGETQEAKGRVSQRGPKHHR